MNYRVSGLRLTVTVRRAVIAVVALMAIYVVLIFSLPANQSIMTAHHISAPQYRIIRLAIAMPGLLAWVTAFVGYAVTREYADSLRGAAEAGHFKRIATGTGWLAWSLPLPVIIALIGNAIADNRIGFQHSAVIIDNYLSLILPLVAFSIISTAARGLITNAKLRFSLTNARYLMILFLALGATYCLLIFRQFSAVSLTSTNNPYYLPIWLMVLSVIIPYLYTWFAGLLAAYEIRLYSQGVSGILYRQSLQILTAGLIVVILSSIGLQYLSAVTFIAGSITIDYRLLLIWLFRLTSAVGFIMLTVGAARLKRIEEV
jgi:hypothetical protein